MIEFDILRTRDGRLVLAHDYADADGRECLTLDEGLDHFAGEAYNGVELDVDLKLPGYEREVIDGLSAGCTSARWSRRRIRRASIDSASSRPGCGAAGPCRACGATTCARRSRCPPTRSSA